MTAATSTSKITLDAKRTRTNDQIEVEPSNLANKKPKTAAPEATGEAVMFEVPVIVENNFPPKKFSVIWDRSTLFDEKDEMEGVLQEADTLAIPSEIAQDLIVDPRICTSLEMLRDSFRHQYNCEDLKLDIRGIRMVYQREGHLLKFDVNNSAWALSNNIFLDDANDNFTLVLYLRDKCNPHDVLFEFPPMLA